MTIGVLDKDGNPQTISTIDDLMDFLAAPAVAAAVIGTGTSLSDAADLLRGRLASIQMPASWDAADLTFQTSADGATYANFYDATGQEYTIPAAASRSILIPRDDFIGVRYLKVRSGTAGAPIIQAADRSLALVLV